jgi:hypothetical protein
LLDNKVDEGRAKRALAEAVGREKQMKASSLGVYRGSDMPPEQRAEGENLVAAGNMVDPPEAETKAGNETGWSIFREPELSMSDGRPVIVPEKLFVDLISDMDDPHAHTADKKRDPFEGHSEALMKAALYHEGRIANHAREHGVILDENGIPTWQGVGEPGMLPVPAGEAKGKTLIHNHPEGSPPGWEDLIEACEQDVALLRIPTKSEVFSVAIIEKNPNIYHALRPFFRDIGDGTGREWMRRHGHSDNAVMAKLVQHAVMAELDRRGYIKYHREPR